MGNCQGTQELAPQPSAKAILEQSPAADLRANFIQRVLADVRSHPAGCELSRDATPFLNEEVNQESRDALVPSEELVLEYLTSVVSQVDSERFRPLLQYAASKSAVLLRGLYQGAASKVTTRLTVPIVIEWIDSAAGVICVSNSMPLDCTAVSHRWTDRKGADHSKYVVVMRDRPSVWWRSAGLTKDEVFNIEPLLPCWLDYVSLVQPDEAMVKIQMQFMGIVYILGRSVICGNDLSPNTLAPSEYFGRLWCKQEYSVSRMRQSRTLDAALDELIAAPGSLLTKAFKMFRGTAQIVGVDIDSFVVIQSLNDCGVSDYDQVMRDHIEKFRSTRETPLSLSELKQYLVCLFELKIYATLETLGPDKNIDVFAFLTHLFESDAAYDSDRVYAALGCVVQLRQGTLAPYDDGLDIQYSSALDFLEMPPVRFVYPAQKCNFLMQASIFSEILLQTVPEPAQAEVLPILCEAQGREPFLSYMAVRGSIFAVFFENPLTAPCRPAFSMDSRSPNFDRYSVYYAYAFASGTFAYSIIGEDGCWAIAFAIENFFKRGGRSWDYRSSTATIQQSLGHCEVK